MPSEALPNVEQRQQRRLGGDEHDGSGDGNVSLHSGHFCVDLSTFEDVEYKEEPRENCTVSFKLDCVEKVKQVHIFVHTHIYVCNIISFIIFFKFH